MWEKIGITPCKVSLRVRKPNLQFALLVSAGIAKSKTFGLIFAVCFKAQAEARKMQLNGSCLPSMEEIWNTIFNTGKRKEIEIMKSWKEDFHFFTSLVFINFNAMT